MFVVALALSLITTHHWQNAEVAVPTSIKLEGRTYVRVSGRELRGAIVGRSIHERDCESSSGCTISYGSDGKSAKLWSDFGLVNGTFDTFSDRVCMKFEGSRVCVSIFRSSDGAFAQLNLFGGQVGRVTINPYPVGL